MEVEGVLAPQRSKPRGGQSQCFSIVEEPSTETRFPSDGFSPCITCVPPTSELKPRAGTRAAHPSLQPRVTLCGTHNITEMRKKRGAKKRSMQYKGTNRVFCAVSLGQHQGLGPLSQHSTATLIRFLIEKIPQGCFSLSSVSTSGFSPFPHCLGKKQLEESQLLLTTELNQYNFR